MLFLGAGKRPDLTARFCLRGDRLLDDADLAHRRKAEESVDALDQFILRMGEEQGAGPLAGNGEHAGLMAAAFAGHLGGAPWPAYLFGPGAIGKIDAGDLIPRAEQKRADAGALGQHRIDQAVGHLADLAFAAVSVVVWSFAHNVSWTGQRASKEARRCLSMHS